MKVGRVISPGVGVQNTVLPIWCSYMCLRFALVLFHCNGRWLNGLNAYPIHS